jgi:four helix bundle protein
MRGKAAESFEELHIYQRARQLTNEVYRLSRDGLFARDVGLVDQIRRAGVSVMSNIAEGFERGTTPEFIQFLFIAKGSCGEVRAQLQIAVDQQYIRSDEHARLNDMCRRISGMISNLIASLQSSEYRGEKFSRPQRLSADMRQREHDALRAAQLANIRVTEQATRAGEPAKVGVGEPAKVGAAEQANVRGAQVNVRGAQVNVGPAIQVTQQSKLPDRS